ncbi:MAG: hypothetical protein ACYS26_09745 [Planctomycetota bacterium]|jgi:hypothetical protein
MHAPLPARLAARLAAPLALALLAACQSTGQEDAPAAGEAPLSTSSQATSSQDPIDPGAVQLPPLQVQLEEAQRWLTEQYSPFGLEFQDGQVIRQPELMVPSVWLPNETPYLKGPTGGWERAFELTRMQQTNTWPQLAFQPTLQIVPHPEHQEAFNQRAWNIHREFLSGLPQGTWVVIAYGLLQGTFTTSEEAWEAAIELGEYAHHAYVYRLGIDDQPQTVVLSPMDWDSPNWTQAGRSLARQWKLVMEAATDTWHRKSPQGESASVTWGETGARLELVGTNGERRRVPGVISAMVQQDLTVTYEDAEALGLLRFQSPMPCAYGREAEPCPRVLVRVEVPELGISSVAVAVVLPKR